MLSLVPQPKDDDLLFQLQEMFGNLLESERQYYDTEPFCKATQVNVHQQQDVEEFFNLLTDRLETCLKTTPTPKLLDEVFAGSIIQEISCPVCGFPLGSHHHNDADVPSRRVTHLAAKIRSTRSTLKSRTSLPLQLHWMAMLLANASKTSNARRAMQRSLTCTSVPLPHPSCPGGDSEASLLQEAA